MVDPEQFKNFVYRAKTSDEKKDDFENSTVSATLKQLGWNLNKIRQVIAETAGLTWSWFNAEVDIPVRVDSTRIFNFNLMDVIEHPEKHPVVEAYKAAVTTLGNDQPVALIFRVGDLRWVATDYTLNRETAIYVYIGDLELAILPFKDFFKRWRLDDEA